VRRTLIAAPAALTLSAALAALAAVGAPRAGAAAPVHPSPYRVLRADLLATPPVDAFPFCVAEDLDPELRAPAETAATGDLDGARSALAERPEAGGAARPLLEAALAARAAKTSDARRAARVALRRAFAAGGPPGALACARLEAARLELFEARFPEAAAHAAVAGRLRSQTQSPGRIGEPVQHYRAEALYLAGHLDAAQGLYQRLAASDRARTAAAARLRLSDVDFDRGEVEAARTGYETLLSRAADFGASTRGWALRAAEAALVDGDHAAAANWVQRFLLTEPPPRAAALARVRMADALVARGDGAPAREALEAVASAHAGTPLAHLARVRLVDLGVDPWDRAQRLDHLRAAATGPDDGVSLYARAVLAHTLRQMGMVEEALGVLARLAYEAPPAEMAPFLAADIDAVMELATARVRGESGCAALVEQVGAYRATLARHARSPEPFLRLAACYEHLHLPAVALEVYRQLIRSFGKAAGEAAALPVARAALATGDAGLARTAAVAGVRRGGPQADRWRVLLGEAELFDGRFAAALEALRPLVERGAPAEDPVRAIVAMARAASRRPASDADRERLGEAIGRLSAGARDAGGERLGEAALLTADLHRQSARHERAVELYALAVSRLSAGVMRAQAAYWLGALHPDPAEGRAAWAVAAETADGGPWARLAATELAMADLRTRVGRRVQPDAPPASAGDGR